MLPFYSLFGATGYIALVITAVAILWLSALYIWRGLNPDSRVGGIAGSIGLAMFAFAGFLLLFLAISEGDVSCGRGCSDIRFEAINTPLEFWMRCAFFYVGGLIFLAGSMKGFYSVIANWQALPTFPNRK
jgi:hypothetical protein